MLGEDAGGPSYTRLMDPFSLTGRTALVTGASRGIGAATARALDAAGARLALVARDVQSLRRVASSLATTALVIEADLSQPESPTEVAEKALAGLGHVDVLVNNAAVAARLPTAQVDGELIDRLYAVNVRAPLLLVARLAPHMVERGSGSIVNISTVSAILGTPRRAAYAATKGALDAATRSLAAELGPFGIRVNSLAPGVVDTAMWARNKTVPGVVEKVNGQTPLGRWAQPEDIADAVVFLASDAARFVTGETLSVDGGMARTLDLYGGEV